MATEDQSSDSTTDEAETAETEATEDTEQLADVETTDQAEADTSNDSTADQQDDTASAAKKALLADLHGARQRAKTAEARVAELDAQVAELAPVKETLDAVQARYDRLEAFMLAVGGPVSQALDSRSFTQKLFETEEDVSKIVKEWHGANPSATSAALSSSASQTGGKATMNDILRAARK